MNPDTSWLDEILQKHEENRFHFGDINNRKFTKAAILSHLTTAEVVAGLKARFVELDLFEQFLNKHDTRGISRRSLYDYKMQRLAELNKRISKEEG